MEAIFSKNSGVLSDISKMPSQHELMSQVAAEKAVREGLQCYEDAMRSVVQQLPVGVATLQAHHIPAHTAAKQRFEGIAYMHDSGVQEYAQ